MEKITTTHRSTKKKNTSSILIDQAVGNKLKYRRTFIGLSQDELAKEIGISFQQVQKYEKGTNRISASRLYQISKILNVPVSFFFDEININSKNNKKPNIAKQSSELNKPESLELVKNFWELSPKARKNLISLLKTLVKNSH